MVQLQVTTPLLALLSATLALALPTAAPDTIIPPQEILPTAIISHDLAWQSPNQCVAPGTRPSTWRRAQGGEAGRSLLFTFTYPAKAQGAQCWLDFTALAPAVVSPNPAQVDVFRSWALGSCSGGSMSNNRDVQLGRLSVPAQGAATWAAVYNGYLTGKVPCPAPGTTEGFELVAAGDNAEVTFQEGGGAGLRIMFA